MWGLPPPSPASSRLVKGLKQRLPNPIRGTPQLCPWGTQGGGPAAVPGWAVRSPSCGEGGWPPAEAGSDITAGSRLAPPPLPRGSPAEKPSEARLAWAFVLPATLRNPGRSPGGRMPQGGRGGSPRGGPEVTMGGGDRFPPGWGMDPDRKSLRG